jgi:hypothetical protein
VVEDEDVLFIIRSGDLLRNIMKRIIDRRIAMLVTERFYVARDSSDMSQEGRA